MRFSQLLRRLWGVILLLLVMFCHHNRLERQPNILFAIADDQSWLHTSAMGCQAVSTPAFDRVAGAGVLFTNAHCAAPSCSPSRAGILTGRPIWQLEDAANLCSKLDNKFTVYPDILEAAGYHVGYTGKGWGPGDVKAGGRDRNPAGPAYNEKQYAEGETPQFAGRLNNDYAGNFELFLKARPAGIPFCFWYGANEPHRNYPEGIGVQSGKRLEDVTVPAFLPDTPDVRSDFLDYFVEIEWFDTHIGKMIEMLEKAGELDNTIIVVTGDNGMPWPRAKTQLYDYGSRVPLAVSWPARVPGGRTVTDFVSAIDLAPTMLEAAGLQPPAEMDGRSLMPILQSDASGRVDPDRDRIVLAKERHAWVQKGGEAYAIRAIRTDQYLYIRNLKPHLWPVGSADVEYTFRGDPFSNTDYGPTAILMMSEAFQSTPGGKRFFQLCYEPRPAEELYDNVTDPDQVHNLAGDPRYTAIQNELRTELEQYLRDSGDPRMLGNGDEVFENTAYYGRWLNASTSADAQRIERWGKLKDNE